MWDCVLGNWFAQVPPIRHHAEQVPWDHPPIFVMPLQVHKGLGHRAFDLPSGPLYWVVLLVTKYIRCLP